MSFTNYDKLHAAKYAEYYLKKYKYSKYSKNPIFQKVVFEERPATPDDFYIPPKLAHKCKVASLHFDKDSCEKIACFSSLPNKGACKPTDPPRYVPFGDAFFLACQPACYSLIPKTLSPFDTVFRGGRCVFENSIKKQFAIQNDVASLSYVEGDMALNERYCKTYGLLFEDGDCVTSTNQEVAEFFLGSTVYRSMFSRSVVYDQPPPLPDWITQPQRSRRVRREEDRREEDRREEDRREEGRREEDRREEGRREEDRRVDDWQEDDRRVDDQREDDQQEDDQQEDQWDGWQEKDRSRRVRREDDGDFDIESIANTDMLVSIAENIAIDTGVEIGVSVAKRLVKKVLPKYLVRTVSQLSARVSQKAVSGMISHMILKKYLKFSLNILSKVGSALTVASTVYGLFSIATMIVDIYDPMNLRKVLNKEQVQNLNVELDSEFKTYMQTYDDDEVDPEMIWDAMEPMEDETCVEIHLLAIDEYLKSLDTNFLGQKVNVIPRPKVIQSSSFESEAFIFLVVTLITFVLSSMCIHHFLWFSLAYLGFVMLYSKRVITVT